MMCLVRFADISDDITGVSPVATIAKDTTPDLTFTGAVAAASSRIGFAASCGGCGSPSYVFQYTIAPATIPAIDTADTYVVCYSIDGGLTYTEQTTFGDAFVVEGLNCMHLRMYSTMRMPLRDDILSRRENRAGTRQRFNYRRHSTANYSIQVLPPL
jgi:hypothetical protein